MRAEDFLQFQFDFWYESYPDRVSLLSYLFCCIGNGYEWVDGELKYIARGCAKNDERMDRYSLNKHVIKAQPYSLAIDIHNDRIALYKRMMNSDDERIRKRYSKMYYDMTHHFKSLSKEYDLIYHVPDNIKPDWLDLCYEVVEYMKAEGIDTSDIVLPEKKILNKDLD